MFHTHTHTTQTARNNLIGDVPSELGMLTKLTYLSLCKFTSVDVMFVGML